MTLEEYCEKLYDEPTKENNMRVCRAVFTIVDDVDTKMNRTEVVEMTFPIEDEGNMFDAMIDFLNDDDPKEEESKSKIITNH